MGWVALGIRLGARNPGVQKNRVSPLEVKLETKARKLVFPTKPTPI
ncbi:MAG: hypothetical protein F6J93_26505 [Oscillatoria sp. SIO1A7]|nr:hypothetical protein [Oscillatoria sp. SIO1A7]